MYVIMSEKITDTLMLNNYKQAFKRYYHTEGNKMLFKQSKPDGWDIIERQNSKPILFIIENKREVSAQSVKLAMKQLVGYYKILSNDDKQYYEIYFVIGVGDNEKVFQYCIYNDKLQNTKLTFDNFVNNSQHVKQVDNRQIVKEIHNINQIIYNELSLQKQQKTLFIAAILICLKIDKDFINISSNEIILANTMINIINDYYQDKVFTNMFKFMSKSIKNNSIISITKRLVNIIEYFDSDIINMFYHEFCQWDKNDDKSFGIVLTPEDIVKLMVGELHINENDKVLDFCCGTGSFIIECGKYTKHLYACECSDERYSLSKCNFILNDYDITHLVHDSCFNHPYKTNMFDKIIINPPFSLDCQDNENINNNSLDWTDFSKEQRFVIYAIELLKPGGIASIIIPRSNFDMNNKDKQRLLFKQKILQNCDILKIYNCNSKVFYPVAIVECTIIVLQKLITPREITNNFITNVLTIDYSNDGYTTSKNKRYKQTESQPIKQQKQITPFSNWNYEKSNDVIDIDELKRMIIEYEIDYEASMKKLFFRQKQNINFNIANTIKYKRLKLSDIIEPIKYKSYTYDKCSDGNIPFYVASQKNIPKGYKNVVSVDCKQLGVDKVLCINKTGEGVVGYCHMRSGKFACNAIVGVYKIKIPLSIVNMLLLQKQLTNKFNHHFKHISIDDINTTDVKLLENTITDEQLYDYINSEYKQKPLNIPTIDNNTKFITLKLSELITIVKPIKTFQIKNTIVGNIPLISSTSINNGITKFINDYSIDINDYYLTINRNGSVGYCFVQRDKIAITQDVIICKINENKQDININLLSILITQKLSRVYSYSNKLTINKLMSETIKYPIC